jgi:hypothetical protein
MFIWLKRAWQSELTERFLVLIPRYLIGFTIAFFLIRLIPDEHEWIRTSLMMLWGIAALASLLHVSLKPWPKLTWIGAEIFGLLGLIMTAGFIIWLGSVIARAVNIIPLIFGLDWRIGPLFHGISAFVFSLPGLITAIILFIIAIIWEDSGRTTLTDHDEEAARMFE